MFFIIGPLKRCTIVSDWNVQSRKYDYYTFTMYAQKCPLYFNNFICEISNSE